MFKFDKYTELESVDQVKAKIDEYNKCVEIFYDAYNWLQNKISDKLDKKATAVILTKHENEWQSWRCEEKNFDDGYGWRIRLSDNRFNSESKSIDFDVVKDDGYGSYKSIGFYGGSFSFDKGATWQEVINSINGYALPKQKSYTMDQLQATYDKLAAMVEECKKIEAESEANYKELGWSYTDFMNNRF